MANYKCNKPYPTSYNGVPAYPGPDKSKPLAPRNIFVTNPYIEGILDIRWDNPTEITENNQWQILGVNIYRSIDSECGPYKKINSAPLGALYYRDKTNLQLIVDENAIFKLDAGTNSIAEWIFRTAHTPIIKEGSQNVLADTPSDIVVRIDNGDGRGLIVTPVYYVRGRTGEVSLITQPIFNPLTKKNEEPRLPAGPNAKCLVNYWYSLNFVKTDLYPRFFYKITTVGKDKIGNIVETKISDVRGSHVHQIEKPHYIWKGIIAKNRYLLEQFGERAKLFIRREVGETCPEWSDTHQQATHYCEICYGTGIVGGYYGPIDVIIAPPEAEKHIDLTDTGLRLNFIFESWTGPSPLIRTRDFIVRQNGERMTIGPVTPQGAMGSVFQQHFTLNYRDTKDIIYKVPIHGGEFTVPVSDDTRGVNRPITAASPVIPDYKSERAKTDKGRTIEYENVVW